ncbi:hypothetical protein C7974DRAFT_402493 [Boeremia exigua]|uniref:uncharacterized protein n=1 Tax=Boeremia exigua TaxID=749465 RepID=UPI001E8D67FC|nr:uncharacterized protein C7974DRAFT_402493 [Boeremia exigua]KAH6616819.1 hypothetical protein C7974DRAFT_402493 [Boeremia exigua]
MPATQAPATESDNTKTVRLHITPFKPELLKVYLAPSVLPLARNISYHATETFPERGFGYVELPEPEAQKIKKKLNGATLKGSKVRIEMAKPEKRKAREEADAEEKPAKRSKKDKKEKKEKKAKSEKRERSPGVFDGVELPEGRKVKRGWTEPASAKTRSSKDKKDKKSKDDKHQAKPSKYTKDAELLFTAKLEPVAATEHTHKEKKKEKKEKKDKKERKTKTKEVIIHEFEKNTKTPSFLKVAKVSTEKKPPVDYIDGVGWVDEDGTVVEPETKKAAHSRVLQLVDGQPLKEPPPTDSQGRPIVKKEAPKPAKKEKKKKAAPPPESSSESEVDDDSSVVSSSSEDSSDSDSDSDSDPEFDNDSEASKNSPAASPVPSPVHSKPASKPTPKPIPATLSTESKEIHPLEALFKRTPTLSTPTKPPPINTTFSFFDNETTSPPAATSPTDAAPTTPFTQRDLEWRGLRSAAPTPDTAAIGRRFSFDWRKGSADAEEDAELSGDGAAEAQLSLNTRANKGKGLADVVEEAEGGEDGEAAPAGEPKEDSAFKAWFWEHRGDINRAWKKRRRDALKAKRQVENRKVAGRRVV